MSLKIEAWENDFIITYNGRPIGPCMSMEHAVVVKTWLEEVISAAQFNSAKRANA